MYSSEQNEDAQKSGSLVCTENLQYSKNIEIINCSFSSKKKKNLPSQNIVSYYSFLLNSLNM